MLLEECSRVIGKASLSHTTKVLYLRNLLEYIEDTGARHVGDLTEEKINHYLNNVKEGKSLSTINQVAASLRFVRRSLQGLKPSFGTKPTSQLPNQYPMSKLNEVFPLLEGSALIAFLLVSTMGLSASDLDNLRKSDLDFGEKAMTLKNRTLQISPLVEGHLQAYYGYAVLFSQDERLLIHSMSHINGAIKQAGIQVGCNNLNLQIVRNSFATHLLHQGFKEKQVCQMLGISNLTCARNLKKKMRKPR